MKIGFIGFGIMGSRMAANLLKKGHELIVHNRTKDKAQPLLDQGAAWAESPAGVRESTSTSCSRCFPNPMQWPKWPSSKALIPRQTAPNSLWVDCSSVNPSFSKLMAVEAKERKVRFLDAPVAGSKGPAEQAQLLFFVGGEKTDVESVKPLFECMGKAVYHIGGHGMGSAMKMVNNLLLGQAMVAFSEALVFGSPWG